MKVIDEDTDIISFGKYSGKTYREICDIDPEYIIWLHENVKEIKFRKSWITAIEMDLREEASELHDIIREHYYDIF
jgi:hypothetical protein